MNNSDFQAFHDTWVNAHAMSSSNKEPADSVVMAVFDVLSDYPISHVLAAIKAHNKRSRFAPTAADIVDLLETKHQHLSADEAWALCPKDEGATVVWTSEIAQAYAACSGMVADGDKIGARMAFKGAYERICNLSKLQNKRPSWLVSVGHDRAQIEAVITSAIKLGRISQENGKRYLPVPQDGGVIGKLLTGKVVQFNSKADQENVKRMKQIIADADKNQSQKQVKAKALAEKKRAEFEKSRKEAIDYCATEAAGK